MVNTDPKLFASAGYCFFPEVLSPEQTQTMRQRLDEASKAQQLDQPQYFGEPHTKAPYWLNLCRHPGLLDAVEAVLGPNLILVYSSMFIKPADNKKLSVGWHQDNTYWPSVHGTDVATVWLAIDDADAQNSAMQVIPGSHRGYQEQATVPSGENEMLSKKIEATAAMEATAVTLEMKAGSLSIHDSFLLHGSGHNRSGRRRGAYTIRYCSTDTAWVDLERHPIPVFLVRGEPGLRGQGYTDLRPGMPCPEL
jgi:non-heme Fe2+,alpha-ketoglutarate-dependent halogenase